MTTTRSKLGFRPWWALAMFVTATLFGVVNRQLLTVVAQPVKLDLNLTDAGFAFIQGTAPVILGGLAAPVFGWLVDRMDRRWLLAGCILAWSAATVACGLAQDSTQLLISAVGVAIGEAVLGPLVYSMIPDLFDDERRVRANLIYFGAALVGAGLAITVSGPLVDALPEGPLAPWRMAFILAALPGPVVALGVALIGKVPHGALAKAAETVTGLGDFLKERGLLLVGIFLGFGLLSIGLNAASTFTVAVVERGFGGTKTEAGLGLGVAVIAGTLLGLALASAIAARWLRTVGPSLPLRVGQVAGVILAVAGAAYGVAPVTWILYVAVGVSLAVFTGAAALLINLLQDLAPAHLRGRVLGLMVVVNLGGPAVGPLAAGLLSDRMGPTALGLMHAVGVVGCVTALAGLLILKLVEGPASRILGPAKNV